MWTYANVGTPTMEPVVVIDHETGIVYTNDSIPIIIGRIYRLMGKGDDYLTPVSVSGRYVTVKGLSDLTLEDTILHSEFDNIVKELMPE